jgi:hypothetical protein
MIPSNRRFLTGLFGKICLGLIAATSALTLAPKVSANPGDLYVSDLATNSIIVYRPDGTSFTFASGLNSPQGVGFNPAGDLIVADGGSGNIYKFTVPDGVQSTIASGFSTPVGIALNGLDLLVSEKDADVVTRVAPDGNKSVFPVTVTAPLGLTSVSVNMILDVYVAASNGAMKVAPDGTATTIYSGDDSHFIAVDAFGNAFLSLGTTGEVLKILVGGGSSTFASGLGDPHGLAFRPKKFSGDTDGVGNLFVTDPTGGFIFQVTPDGIKTTFASGGQPNYCAFETGKLVPGVPVIDSPLDATGMVGQAFSYTITASNSPTSFDATGLPGGLTVDTGTGVISGTPTEDGTFNVTLSATNAVGTGTAVLRLVVNPVISTPTPSPTPGLLRNISTRDDVLTGDNVLIGGFIITGGATSKTVVIRGLGPSLATANPPVAGTLADPVLTLTMPDGTTVTNDNWKDNTLEDQTIITGSGLAPGSDSEAVIVATLPPVDPSIPGNGYTAKVSGLNDGTGVALMEVYDLDDPLTTTSQLANISTRGFVGMGDNVMIGGFISGPGTNDGKVLLRALGPSLTDANVPGALQDPTVELFNGDGESIEFNDNWQDTAGDEILATGLAPANDAESAILTTQVAGNYTFVVRGVNNTTGVGLVEAYHLPNQPTAAPRH